MGMFQNLGRTLSHHQTLKIECTSCQHRAAWPREKAIELLGEDATPYDIRHRLRCGQCGDRHHVRSWI